MKKIAIIIASLILLISLNAEAGKKPEKKADKMALILKLNRAEKAKVLAVYRKTSEAKDKIKKDKRLSEEEKKLHLDELKQHQKNQLKAIVGETRYDKFKNETHKKKESNAKDQE